MIFLGLCLEPSSLEVGPLTRCAGSRQAEKPKTGAFGINCKISIPHQSNMCHAGVVRHVHHLSHELEINLRITLQECHLLDAAHVDFLQLCFEIVPANLLFIDFQCGTLACTGILELDDNGCLWWRYGVLIRWPGNF